MTSTLERIKRWFRGETVSAEDVVEGATPVATPPPGAESDSTESGDVERETSTDAQTEGAADEPWPGNT